jgi:hypothetical protein
MDPITLAIVAAGTAGITKIGEQTIIDAYSGLKELIKRKFGAGSEVVKAAEAVEAKPSSNGRAVTLGEEVESARVQDDLEIVEAANALLAKLKEVPRASTVINQNVTGDRNIFSGSGDVAVDLTRK